MASMVYFKEKVDPNLCFLSTVYITSLIANLAIGYRYVRLGFLTQSGGVLIFPFSLIISDIIAEAYGNQLAKKLVLYGIVCQFIFALYAGAIIRLPAPNFLQHAEFYVQIFDPYITFAFASTVSIWIGSKINIVLLSKLSECIGGRLFALRTIVSSSVGEFIVTLTSMLLANYSRMDLMTLMYMVVCCFSVKTAITMIGIWPAALIVYKIENPERKLLNSKNEWIKHPMRFAFRLLKLAWHAKGYIYHLESINLKTQKVNLYFRGARGVITLPLQHMVTDMAIIRHMKSIDSAHLGYHYSKIENLQQASLVNSVPHFRMPEPNIGQYCLKIMAVDRDKKLTISDKRNCTAFKKKPSDLYDDINFIERFEPAQSLYIGYLAGKMEKTANQLTTVRKAPFLRVIK